MISQRVSLAVVILASWTVPSLAAPPATAAVEFSSGTEPIAIDENESNPVVISRVFVTCPRNGWIILRAQAQFGIIDNGDRGTNLMLAITLNGTRLEGAGTFWAIGGEIGSGRQTPASGQRIDRCNKGDSRTYYFVAAQNNTGDDTVAEAYSLVAEFFDRRF
jgi:hypothetical protein